MTELLDYDADEGVFRWKRGNSRKRIGDAAGHTDRGGYTKICIDGVKYYAHRLAWFYHYKTWPSGYIDHIDRCRSNNRIQNLRDTNQTINGLNGALRVNNTSGHTGVSFDPRRKKWVAYIHLGWRKKHVGSFSEKHLAAEARSIALSKAMQQYIKGVMR